MVSLGEQYDLDISLLHEMGDEEWAAVINKALAEWIYWEYQAFLAALEPRQPEGIPGLSGGVVLPLFLAGQGGEPLAYLTANLSTAWVQLADINLDGKTEILLLMDLGRQVYQPAEGGLVYLGGFMLPGDLQSPLKCYRNGRGEPVFPLEFSPHMYSFYQHSLADYQAELFLWRVNPFCAGAAGRGLPPEGWAVADGRKQQGGANAPPCCLLH